MTTLEVFDRPMCCSTGVCGPQVDPALVAFAADLDWLRRRGVKCDRFNLAQQPQQFMIHEDIKAALQDGTDVLPIVRIHGRIVSRGEYPSRKLLASWVGVNVVDDELPVIECNPSQGCC